MNNHSILKKKYMRSMQNTWYKSPFPLFMIFLFLLSNSLGLLIIEKTKIQKKNREYSDQVAAAVLMQQSLAEIKAYRLIKNIPLDKYLDINETGIIGDEYTALTTTVGDLPAKRTATNPAFAALMVRFFTQAHLKPHDVVAIGASGSFPSLILATLCAAKTLQLKTIIIYSLGSSTYGANITGFTFIDMLKVLKDKNLLQDSIYALSLGGDNDQAENLLLDNAKDTFLNIISDSHLAFINCKNLEENIHTRLSLYTNAALPQQIACFVNIGGSITNFGDKKTSLQITNGLIHNKTASNSGFGHSLISQFINKNIPVIHLLNIKKLAVDNGIPIDPYPLPDIGTGSPYYSFLYRKPLLILCIFISLSVVIIGAYYKRVKIVTK